MEEKKIPYPVSEVFKTNQKTRPFVGGICKNPPTWRRAIKSTPTCELYLKGSAYLAVYEFGKTTLKKFQIRYYLPFFCRQLVVLKNFDEPLFSDIDFREQKLF